MDKGNKMSEWNIEIDKHQFRCKHDPKECWVYVECSSFDPGYRTINAGRYGPDYIAKLFAAEIISEDQMV